MLYQRNDPPDSLDSKSKTFVPGSIDRHKVDRVERVLEIYKHLGAAQPARDNGLKPERCNLSWRSYCLRENLISLSVPAWLEIRLTGFASLQIKLGMPVVSPCLIWMNCEPSVIDAALAYARAEKRFQGLQTFKR